ncbi:Aldo/keto reductase family-domain-containing protein [Pestalotiopsis sp. NC0098]|nr:Aldo/keto reductase family-domain-containing protein [Pestalotiopsis sp. NC0098]
MTAMTTQIPEIPNLILGGAGFSYQLHPDPESLPLREILLRAFDLGLHAIDTSPYYEPSEQLLGAALSHPEIKSRFPREDIILMTKVGRITEKRFDYSPAWVRKSVTRSLDRFQTTYLDVVFCHDVEFVAMEEAIGAVEVLLEFQRAGKVRRVGISGYDIETLARIAAAVQDRYGRPVDVVQTWAQLTLQNLKVEKLGLDLFQAAGVTSVLCSSPLAVGLLRKGGIPKGRTGDWHPAPPALRQVVQTTAEWVEQQSESMASVALRYAIAKSVQNCRPRLTVSTIMGVSTMTELEENVATAKSILKAPTTTDSSHDSLRDYTELDEAAYERDRSLYDHIQDALGHWLDYDFAAPKDDSRKQMDDFGVTKGSDVVEAVEISPATSG